MMKTLWPVVVYMAAVTELCWVGKGEPLKMKCDNELANYILHHSILQFMSGLPITESMPIIQTTSPELRLPVPTVGTIHSVLAWAVKTTSTVMAHNLDWLILTLDKSSTVAVITTSGVLRQSQDSCCSCSQQESTLLRSHCTTTVTVNEVGQ